MTDSDPLADVSALTFDLFGTVLDLAGSLRSPIASFLEAQQADVTAEDFWAQWRGRQRIEQYQDNIIARGHGGYRVVARRACVYTLALNGIEVSGAEVDTLMAAWEELRPFDDVVPAFERLTGRYQLVALSNGEPPYLEHLAENRIGWSFDRIISVQIAGAFKPDPAVYHRAADVLGLAPSECLMVSANSFDVMGARLCGFRGAFVNREGLPYEDSPARPDLEVADFTTLADELLAG